MQLIIYFQEMWQLAIQGQTQGIWFWAAFYTLVVCSYSVIFQCRTRRWPVTQGELIDTKVAKFGATDWVRSNQDYVSKALFKYDVSGVVYDGVRVSPWIIVASHNARFLLERQMSAIEQLPNGKVKVYYNPNKPQKSYLIVAGKIGICITLAISVLPFILFYFKYHV